MSHNTTLTTLNILFVMGGSMGNPKVKVGTVQNHLGSE